MVDPELSSHNKKCRKEFLTHYRALVLDVVLEASFVLAY